MTLLALAVDPFTQQVTSYRPQKTLVATNSTTPVRWCYDDQLNSLHQGAVYGGILGNQPRNITLSCPTGNCTWQQYSTLAVCSQCLDLSDLVHNEEDNCEGGCSLPNGLRVDILQSSYYPQWAFPGPANFSADLEPIRLHDVGYAILNFTLLSISNRTFDDVLDHPRIYPSALECALYWCINTYNASVESSITNEVWISSSHKWSEQPSMSTNATGGAESYSGDEYVVMPQETTDEIVTSIPLPGEYSGPFNISTLQNMTTTPFYVFMEASEQMSHWIRSIFTLSNNVTWDGFFNRNDGSYRRGTLPVATDIFSNIASGLTTLVRQHPINEYMCDNTGIGIAVVNGSTWANDTYLHVRWEWLILPSCLVALTFLFLTLTMVQTRRNDIAIWKTSTLALLFHGLEAKAVGLPDCKLQLSEMEETARRIKVQLDSNEGTWRMRMSI